MKITKEEYNSLKQLDRIEISTNLLIIDNQYKLSLTFWVLLFLMNVVCFSFISIIVMLLHLDGTDLYYLQLLNVNSFKFFGFFIIVLAILDTGLSIYFKDKKIKELRQKFKL